MDVLVALIGALAVTIFCVKFASVATSISKPASLPELSAQVRLIFEDPPEVATSALGPTPPRLIPPPKLATHTSCGFVGLINTRSTHACGKLVTSVKLDQVRFGTVTSGVYNTPLVPVATYISLVAGLMVTELMSMEIAPLITLK